MSESPDTQAEAVCANHKPVQHRDGRPPWCPNCQSDNKPPSRFDPTPSAEPDGEACPEHGPDCIEGCMDPNRYAAPAQDDRPPLHTAQQITRSMNTAQDGAEVEALAKVAARVVHRFDCEWCDECSGPNFNQVRLGREVVETILASDWLAQRDKDRDAVVAAKVAERIAQAIEAQCPTLAASGYVCGACRDFALVARQFGRG